MAPKSKLKMALAAEKGVDYSKQSLKKAQKQAAKQKRAKTGGVQDSNGQKSTGKKSKKGEVEEEDWEDVSGEEGEQSLAVGEDLEEEGGLTEDEEDIVDGPQVCASSSI